MYSGQKHACKTPKPNFSGLSKYEKYANESGSRNETILKHFLVIYHSPAQR